MRLEHLIVAGASPVHLHGSNAIKQIIDFATEDSMSINDNNTVTTQPASTATNQYTTSIPQMA